MSHTRVSIAYSPYNKGTGQKTLDILVDITDVADADFFNKLYQLLQQYNVKHLNFLKNYNEASLQRLAGQKPNLDISHFDLTAIFELLAQRAQNAIDARQGYIFGFGANEAAYTQAKKLLADVATYLIETSFYKPKPKTLYLLTALKESPEAFISVYRDQNLQTELAVKKAPIHHPSRNQQTIPSSNQPSDEEKHISGVEKSLTQLEANLRIKLTNKKSERNRGWIFKSIINFFVDLVSNEKQEINELKKQISIATETLKTYKTAMGQYNLDLDAFKKNSKTLLGDNPSQLTDSDLSRLQSAIKKILSQGRSRDKNDVLEFLNTLQDKIVSNLDGLTNDAFDESKLKNLFAFLAVDQIEHISHVKKMVIAAANKKLLGFTDPATALRFIENLKKVQFDKEIHSYEEDFKAWENIQKNGTALINGSLNVDLKSLQSSVVIASKSKLSQINESLKFITELQNKIVTNLDELKNEGFKESTLKNQFAFLAVDETTSKIDLINNARSAVIKAINDKVVASSYPITGLRFIENLKKTSYTCLDNKEQELQNKINAYEQDFKAWENIQKNEAALINGTINDELIQSLHDDSLRASKSALPKVKESAVKLNKLLELTLLSDFAKLQQCDLKDVTKESVLVLKLNKILKFYTSSERYEDEAIFKKSKERFANYVRNAFKEITNSQDGFAFIAKLNLLDQDTLKAFDPTLHQEIQNKNSQYESLKLVENGWVMILDDQIASKMTSDTVERFIAATLWLDQPNVSNNPFIQLLSHLDLIKTNLLEKRASVHIDELQKSLLADFEIIAKGTPSNEKQEAIKRRFQFITLENSLYTKSLGNARAAVKQAILKELDRNDKSIVEASRYLKDLESVLPDDFKADQDIKLKINSFRKNNLLKNLEDEYQQLLQKFEAEINFIKTGELSWWEKCVAKENGKDPLALTEENLDRWRTDLIRKITSTLIIHVDHDLIGLYKEEEILEKKATQEILYSFIRDTMGDLSKEAVAFLKKCRPDLQVKQARARFDRIMGCEPDKSVKTDTTLDAQTFVRHFLGIVPYQSYYQKNNASLVEPVKAYIDRIHQVFQHEGWFVTKILPHLTKDSLEAIYYTLKKDSEVKIKKDGDKGIALEGDIIGVVDPNQNSHFGIQQHLLLYLVLETIVADFDKILRNQPVDVKLLNDRIEFAIPQLMYQYQEELSLNDNQLLREDLSQQIAKMAKPNIEDQYHQLIKQQLPNDIKWDGYNITNLTDCEGLLLKQIISSLNNQLDILKNVSPELLSYKNEEEAIVKLNNEIADYKENIEDLEANIASHVSGIKDNPTAQPNDIELVSKTTVALINKKEIYIEKMVAAENLKIATANKLAAKKVQIAQFNDYKDQLEYMKGLGASNISLRELIEHMSPCLLKLLNPELAAFCRKVKDNIEFSNQKSINELSEELLNGDINVLTTINKIPENIIQKLPNETADLVRQLQYRFADRFKHLMIKLFDNNNINKIQQTEKDIVANTGKVTSSSWTSLWSKPVEKVAPTPTAMDRLKSALDGLPFKVRKDMLDLIASAENAGSYNISEVHKSTDTPQASKPVSIKRGREPLPDQKKTKSKPIEIGNPESRRILNF